MSNYHVKVLIFLILASTAFGGVLKPPRGMVLNHSHKMSRGLVGAWLMNEGSGVPYEQIGSVASTWTNLDRIGWVAGKYGSAVSQSLDYGIFDTNTQYFDGTQPFSLNIAVDYVDDGALQYVCNSNADAGIGYYCYIDDASSRFVIYDGTNQWIVNGGGLTDGFYDIVLTWDGSTAKMFLNSVLHAQDTTGAASEKSGTADLYLGSSITGASALVGGKIHYCYQWDRALSASEISLLYREPFCMFQQDTPVMYASGAAPATPAGHVIFINMGKLLLIAAPSFFAASKLIKVAA